MKPKRSYDEITEVIPEPVKVAVTPSFKHLNFVLVEEYFATGRPKVEIQKAKILRVEEPSDVEISKELSDLQNAVINNHY